MVKTGWKSGQPGIENNPGAPPIWFLQVLIMDRRFVISKYLRGWFLLDFVASFPIDLLFMGRRLDIWRLPRLLKIIRVLHYKTFTQAGELVKPLCRPCAGFWEKISQSLVVQAPVLEETKMTIR